jgi:hypothetical protein
MRCTFCGIGLSLQGGDGEAVLRVLEQPELQKDMVINPVEEHGGEISGERIPPTSQVEDAQPAAAAARSDIPAADSRPSGPTFQPEMSSSGFPAYSTVEAPKSASGSKRWLVIGGAVLLILIVLCVCVAVGFGAILRNANF